MIRINCQVEYKNVLGEWHNGEVIGINKATYRIIDPVSYKIMSISKNKVRRIAK